MIKLRNLIAMLCIFGATACTENNISFDEVVNVPEGIYLSGSSSEFSVPIEKGRLTTLTSDNMLSIRAWLKKDGRFTISFVGEDGQPVAYGKGDEITLNDSEAKAFQLKEKGEGFSVPAEGLYQLVLNVAQKELTILPISFTMQGDEALTADGNKSVALSKVTYDKVTHIVTWSVADSTQQLFPGKYVFKLNDGTALKLRDSETENCTISKVFTGTGSIPRTNQLSEQFQPLTDASDVKMLFPLKGQFNVQVQYSVLTGKYTARMGGKGVEMTGLANELYMGGSNFGAWNTNKVVKMAPVGAVGNGEFWYLSYLHAGQTIEWATSKDGANAFSSLKTMQGVTVDGNGKATVKTSGSYLIYVNLDRKSISFETPKLYATGAAMGETDKPFVANGSRVTVETTATGNLNLFAGSEQNARDWTSMRLTVQDGKLVFPGTSQDNIKPLVVSKGTPVSLNLANNTVDYGGSTPDNLMPESVTALYMTGKDFGNWDWESPKVVSFENGYAGDSRWFYIAYLRQGEKLEFSTIKAFGRGNFAKLQKYQGYTVENDRAVVPSDGIYLIYVGLDTHEVDIQPLSLGGYCGSARVDFTTDPGGKTMSATIPADGRMRIYPNIPAFNSVPKFGEWKREVYVDPTSKDFLYRKKGSPEPNKDYSWKAGTKITINFVTNKATIVEP